MEQEELFRVGFHGERDAVFHATVTPANVRRVFRGVVLGIENQDFAIVDELKELGILFVGKLPVFLGNDARFFFHFGAKALEQFNVGQVTNIAGIGEWMR